MRKISADYIFPVSSPPLKNGILIVDDDGYISSLVDTHGNLTESENLEFYNGIIVPGFINAHCHIELSHLRNKIQKHTGLPGFLTEVYKIRKAENEEILQSILSADKEMIRNGIVAVGDISNNNLSFNVKAKSSIKYHTFIEIFDISIATESVIFNALKMKDLASEYGLPASVIPHAPYTVSEKLYSLIQQIATENNSLFSTHNQECDDENRLYIDDSGRFHDIKLFPVNFKPTGQNSLLSLAKYFVTGNNKLLVHNTYTSENDIAFASEYLTNLFWIMCPQANLYIENKLPEIDNFVRHNQNIAIGTDSLASNSDLSVLKELIIISENFPSISLENLVKWATINGARSLNIENLFGSLETGRKPGINLIDNINYRKMSLTDKSTVKVLA